jgi:hypothetical protein
VLAIEPMEKTVGASGLAPYFAQRLPGPGRIKLREASQVDCIIHVSGMTKLSAIIKRNFLQQSVST